MGPLFVEAEIIGLPGKLYGQLFHSKFC